MRHVILGFLWLMALIAYVQRSAISVPLQEIGRDLSLIEATKWLGILQSAWHLGYALMQLPAGRLADRVGGRTALLIYATGWSLATAMTGLARNYNELLLAWLAMGMLQAGAFPCAVRSIGQVFGDKERARASGWLGSGMLAGGAIAPVLTAWLLERLVPIESALGTDRWRICLVLYALPGLAWVAAYAFGTARRLPTDSCSMMQDSFAANKQVANVGLHSAADESSSINQPANVSLAVQSNSIWSSLVSDRSLLLLCGQQFFRAAAMVFFLTWFPTFLRETRGVTQLESGVMTTYAGIAAMIGALSGGYFSDWVLKKTGNKRMARQGVAVFGMSTCALLITMSYFVTNMNIAIGLISFGAFVATFGGVAGYTVAIDYGGKHVGIVFGAMNMCGGIGAMLFPVTVGWLVSSTNNWNMALFVFAGLMTIDAILWACLNPRGTFRSHAT